MFCLPELGDMDGEMLLLPMHVMNMSNKIEFSTFSIFAVMGNSLRFPFFKMFPFNIKNERTNGNGLLQASTF
jgi:hypothetical protein